MPKNKKAPRDIAVFIASPNDLAIERKLFRKAIDHLNDDGFGEGAVVRFEALGWEDTLATTGRRSQGVINQEIDRCDVFILVLNRRWGQKAPDSDYSSYTEEEFHRALDRFTKDQKPEIFVFFKKVDPESEADAGPQLKKVMNFRQHLEDTRNVLYRYFDDDDKPFTNEVNSHLIAYAKGELPSADAPKEKMIWPSEALEALEELKKSKTETQREAQRAEKANQKAEAAMLRADVFALEAAEEAATAALEGRVEHARQKFATATNGTTNGRILALAFQFYYRTGELDTAQEMLEIGLAALPEDSDARAVIYNDLGLVYEIRGLLDKAVEYYQKALKINEELGNIEGMASEYCNLGNVHQRRWKLDKAEEYYNKALEINKALGRKRGMARDYSNLGIVYQTRGDLDKAVEHYNKALEIDEALGHKEGMASEYCNLGNVFQTHEDLDKAEGYYNKALEINKVLGRQEGIANAYGNIGNLYKMRGDLDKAVVHHKKSLEINEALGRKEGMAKDYGNLGAVYENNGGLNKASEYWQRSLDLFTEVGALPMIKQLQGYLDNLDQEESN